MKCRAALLFLIFLSSVKPFCQDNSDALQVGTAKINITPREPVFLTGYPMQLERITDQIHDSLLYVAISYILIVVSAF